MCGPGPWWAVQGARRGGGNTERVSHRFWARQAATAERGAHSWLAGQPALMSFPHGPEFPARHDHTGKKLPRPPPPQLPPSHRTVEGEGGGEASATGPPEMARALAQCRAPWEPPRPGPHGSLTTRSPPCPGLHTAGCRRSTGGEITSNFGALGPTLQPPPPFLPVLPFGPSSCLELNKAAVHPEGSGEGGSWKRPHPVPHSLGWRTAFAKANGTVSTASHAVLVPGPGP